MYEMILRTLNYNRVQKILRKIHYLKTRNKQLEYAAKRSDRITDMYTASVLHRPTSTAAVEEDGGSNIRLSYMETRGLCPIFHPERQGISQVGLSQSSELPIDVCPILESIGLEFGNVMSFFARPASVAASAFAVVD